MFAKPTIYNLAMASAGTEYSQALPANTKKFAVRSRQMGTLKMAFAASEIASGAYWTIPAAASHAVDGFHITGRTLYLASDTASDVAEILVWTDS